MWALADPELNGYVGSAGTVGEAWPHLQQVCRLERQRVVKGKKQVAVSYAISSLPATDADARRLLSLSRGHWGIENRLHWVRTGCDLRRGPLSGAHWGRPTGSGGPAEPGHQLGTSGWAFQRSRCTTPPQCPSQRSFRHDGLFLPGRRMKRPWDQNPFVGLLNASRFCFRVKGCAGHSPITAMASTSTNKSGSAKPATTNVVLVGRPSGGNKASRALRTFPRFSAPTT